MCLLVTDNEYEMIIVNVMVFNFINIIMMCFVFYENPYDNSTIESV